MARYIVATRRDSREDAPSALDAITGEPGVKVLQASDPHMVTIEADPEAAARLEAKLGGTHFVEPEIRRGLH